MTPRPIYRWKSFWLGVLVLMFMGWAWRDSMRAETWFQWKRSIFTAWGVLRVEGTTFFFTDTHTFVTERRLVRFPRNQSAAEMEESAFGNLPGEWYVRVPDAGAALAFGALWSAWLVRQGKREKRKASA